MCLVSTTTFHFLLGKVFETYQVYLTYLSLLNSFQFLVSRKFPVFLKILNNYFFRQLAYESLLVHNFSVIINYTMWSSNLFLYPAFFPRFSWARFFRVHVIQGPDFSGSRSRVWVQVLEVALKNKDKDRSSENLCEYKH